MTRNTVESRLRALAAEGDAIYKSVDADKTRESLTEEEGKRIAQIGVEMTQGENDLDAIDRRSGFEGRVKALKTPSHVPVDANTEPVAAQAESRDDFNSWPVEEAAQFYQIVHSMDTTRQLPGNVHADYRSLYEKRAPTGQGNLIDSEGGFLVPTSISDTILQHQITQGQIVSRTQGVPISVGNTTSWNAIVGSDRSTAAGRFGGIRAYRTAEAGSFTGSQAAFERVALQLKKLTALVYLTDENIEDASQVASIVNGLVPQAITYKIESEMMTGDGVGQMEGILESASLVSVAKESGQVADTVLYENVINMYARLHAASRSNSVWLINQDIEPQLNAMSLAVGTGGVPVYMPAGGLSASPNATLMGRPVIAVEHASTLGDKGDILLADLSQYLYATKGGIKSAQSMHVNFTKEETAFRFSLRNDGKSWWKSAITPVNGSNTQSPFVTLDARA